MPYLSKILIFPIKSLDGIALTEVPILASGALQGDREFALVDEFGKFVNAKRTAKIHQIRAKYDLAKRTVSLNVQGNHDLAQFHLDDDRAALAAWFSHFFGFSVQLLQNTQTGFPDDPISPGPTVICTETLEAVTSWFPGLTLEEMRQRFRTNLEITGAEPFWDDRLFSSAATTVPFQIGGVGLEGVNPCQRCSVPTRDPIQGQVYAHFQKIFVEQRQQTLPTWVDRSRFNHFYRLAVNTRLQPHQTGKMLRIEDNVILNPIS